jgi:class 3 adenylate cyclase
MQRRSGGLAAVLFTDIVNSTAVAAEMGNARWSELVARHHRIVRRQLGRSGGREIDTAGDGFFVIFDRPADAIRCAVASAGAVRELGVEIRAGVSFGEMDTSGQKPSGLAVNTAARVMSMAGPGEVLVPVSVREIVSGTGIAFSENGTHHLRGLEGEFRLFRVTEVDGTAPAPPLDPEDAAERRREILPRGRRRTPLLVGIVAGVVALTAIGALLLSGGGTEPSGDAGPLRDAVARFDVDEGRVETSHFLGERGIDSGVNAADIDRLIAVGEGYVWLLQPPFLLQVDPRLEGVRDDQIFVGAAESQNVLTGLGKVWVLTGPVLFEVHPGTGETSVFFELPPELGLTTSSLALGQAVWVGTSGGTLFRLDPSTGEQRQMTPGRASTRWPRPRTTCGSPTSSPGPSPGSIQDPSRWSAIRSRSRGASIRSRRVRSTSGSSTDSSAP